MNCIYCGERLINDYNCTYCGAPGERTLAKQPRETARPFTRSERIGFTLFCLAIIALPVMVFALGLSGNLK